MDDLIQKKKDKRTEEKSKVQKNRDLAFQVMKMQESMLGLSKVIQQMSDLFLTGKTTTNIANFPDGAKPQDIEKVVKQLDDVIVSQTVTTDDLNESFKDIAAGMMALADEISELPKEYDNKDVVKSISELAQSIKKLDKSDDTQKALKALTGELKDAVGELKLDPKIDVKASDVKIELEPITSKLDEVIQSFKGIELPEQAEVDLSPMQDTMIVGFQELRNSLERLIDKPTPVPHFPVKQLDTIQSNTTPKGQFDDFITAERTPIIELKANYGLSNLRDITTVAGTGAVTNDNTEYNLSTGTTTGSTATLDSAERGRYLPGAQAQAGIGIRCAETFTGDEEARWGYFDDNNGFGFGVDATGLFTFTRRNGTDTDVYQSSWNSDKVDGTGDSGATLTLNEGNIFQIDYTWYGYGVIEYSIIIPNVENQQKRVVVHRFSPSQQTSVLNPNLPIRAYVSNGTGTNDLDLYVGGRQYSVYTPFSPNTRVNSHFLLSKGSINTTFLPVISFRRKSSFISVASKFEGFDLISDADLVYQVRLNGSLTGASYGTPANTTASETAMEVDTTASAISGGELLYEGLVNSSGSGTNQTGAALIDSLNIDIPADQPISLCVRRITGTGATVSASIRWTEEW